jgi:ligand-binding sensor domain-containing protein
LNEDDTIINQLGPIREIIGMGEYEMLINMGSGVVRFNHRTGAYRTYTLRDLFPENEKQIYISGFNKLYFDTPYLWIGTNQGLLQYHLINENPAGFYEIHRDYSEYLNTVNDIVPTGEDLLWIAAPYGLYQFNKKNKEFSEDLLATQIRKNMVDLCMASDASGNLWIGYGGNLYYYDTSAGMLSMKVENFVNRATDSDYPDEPAFSNDSIVWYMRSSLHKIDVKNDQSMWISSQNYLIKYNPLSLTFRKIYSSEGKNRNKGDLILDNLLDSDQNIWISQEFSGISYLYHYKPIIHFIRDRIEGSGQILSTAYNLDVFDNGEVWVARHNGKGLARIDMKQGTIVEYHANQLSQEITRRMVRDRDGKMWAIADGGIIYSCDPEKDEYQYYDCRDSISTRNRGFLQWLWMITGIYGREEPGVDS